MNRDALLQRHWHWLFLIPVMIFSLYLRIVNPWNAIFVEEVRFIGNDPWYYSRLIENCLANFPSRIWFDAFTNFPYGTYIHFGPFLVYFGAFLSKILGASNVESIRSIIVFIPAIGGTLLVLPVYLLVKEAFNKKAGVISAVLVGIMPGQLLYRSLLGFNDHHIWEVFWTIATLALFVKSINLWKGRDIRENIRDRSSLIVPILAGISFGLYLLSWAAGFILGVLIIFFIFLVFVFQRFLKADTKSLAITGVLMFFTASLVYLPFAFKYPGISLVYYSPFQLFILLTSAVILLIFFAIDVLQEKGYWKKIGLRRDDASSLIVLVLGIFALSVIFVMFPNVIKSVIGVVTPGAYGRTIAEVQPFFIENGEFSLYRAWDQFSITFFFAIPAIIYLIYKLYRERGECHLFILIWSVAMLVALAGQIRFAYYFGAVSAVLSGVMVEVILEKIGFYRFKEAEVSRSKKGKKKYKKGVDYSKLISGILILLITLFPTASSAYSQSSSSTLIASHSTINDDWYETLKWMREYTPNGSFYDSFYYQSYETSKGERYPSDAYGVMSWWDYGHWITAIAHRIPNANPFQQGAKTASLFFTAMNESEASEILNELGSKYVITDIEMASLKYGAIRVWAEDEEGYFKIVNVSLFNHTIGLPFNSEKFYSTTLGRLHYLDGNGLENFRLIHESENYVVTYKVANLGTGRIDTVMFKGNYSEALNFYLQLRNNPSLMSLGNSYAILYDPTPPSSYVKIFEYVKGGVIKGTATQTVKISATIETNNGRTFQYIQTIEPVNGYYEVRVPYSSTMPYDVKIIGDYTVKSGGVVKHVSFTEEEIQKGVTKTVNF